MLNFEKKCYKERIFDIRVIASFVEVCYLGGVMVDEIFDFCSFILGEEVNYDNINSKRESIMGLLNVQYPNFKRELFLSNGAYIDMEAVEKIVNSYRKEYGDKIIIRVPKPKMKTLVRVKGN